MAMSNSVPKTVGKTAMSNHVPNSWVSGKKSMSKHVPNSQFYGTYTKQQQYVIEISMRESL